MYLDIIEALSEHFKSDALALDTLNDFLELFLHNPKKITDDFRDEIEEYCDKKNICPMCFKELETKKEIINQTEAWGRLVNEYEYRKICRNCNWQSEN